MRSDEQVRSNENVGRHARADCVWTEAAPAPRSYSTGATAMRMASDAALLTTMVMGAVPSWKRHALREHRAARPHGVGRGGPSGLLVLADIDPGPVREGDLIGAGRQRRVEVQHAAEGAGLRLPRGREGQGDRVPRPQAEGRGRHCRKCAAGFDARQAGSREPGLLAQERPVELRAGGGVRARRSARAVGGGSPWARAGRAASARSTTAAKRRMILNPPRRGRRRISRRRRRRRPRSA